MKSAKLKCLQIIILSFGLFAFLILGCSFANEEQTQELPTQKVEKEKVDDDKELEIDKYNVSCYFGKTIDEIKDIFGEEDSQYSAVSDGSIYGYYYYDLGLGFLMEYDFSINDIKSDEIIGALIFDESDYHYHGVSPGVKMNDVKVIFGNPDMEYDCEIEWGYTLIYYSNSIDGYSVSFDSLTESKDVLFRVLSYKQFL